MLKEKVKCNICRTYRADRFCMVKARNICWHCCNDIRAKGKCPPECEYTPKKTGEYSINVKVFSLSEILDLFKKQADYWFIKPNPAFDNKSPLEIAETTEGKKQLEKHFSNNKIPAYQIAKIYKEKLKLDSINLEDYPKPPISFEERATEYLNNLILKDWNKMRKLLLNKVYEDENTFQKYVKRTLEIKKLKKLRKFDILSSGMSENKTEAIVHFEINGKDDLLITLKNENNNWFVKERILGDIPLLYAKEKIAKNVATLLSRNKKSEAYEFLKRFSEIYIDFADWYYYFSKYYELSGNLNLSLKNMITTAELEPEDIPYLNELAILYAKTNDLESARNYWEKILKIDKNNIDSLNNLGIYFMRKKELQKARDLFEKCLQINPNFENAKKNLKILEDIS